MSVINCETEDQVAIIAINRREVRNAIDRPAAEALAEAFRRFDADGSLSVAVLTGANGIFCSGADLKAVAGGRGNNVTSEGDGPLGCTRMLLSKPVIAAVEGYAVAGGLELEQWSMALPAALGNEYRHGIATIRSGETAEGARRFAAGTGRHGQF